MITLDVVLLICAVASFVAAACGVASRVNLIAVGLALVTLSFITP
jgi:hypothetical protein